MKTTGSRTYRISKRKVLHVIVFLTAMLSISMQSLNALAESPVPHDYRVSAASDKFSNTMQYAFAWRLRPPRRLKARYLEFTTGVISTASETRPFVSLGPVWQLPVRGDRLFVQLGFCPTLIAGSTLNGRDMGGNFHFTSSASVGAELGHRRALSVALRVQHTSNGGLSSRNPGLDMIGLNLSYSFTNQ